MFGKPLQGRPEPNWSRTASGAANVWAKKGSCCDVHGLALAFSQGVRLQDQQRKELSQLVLDAGQGFGKGLGEFSPRRGARAGQARDRRTAGSERPTR